ncbi:LiaF transmembrane domain-containing protein [Gorillibacterium sp. sgz5001074]|uniref:LiaF transmembrane domain-containing protein n=1 Tax=Gorillibacterium sp. sgz5001074 TaxID=3446695 RepID=UPI003F6744CA
MKVTGKSGFALLLIGCGALILLSKMGVVLHGLAGYLFPLALAYLGYYGIKRGRTFLGWALLGIGTFALLCKLSGLIAIVIAAGFIYYGITLLKNNNHMETEV